MNIRQVEEAELVWNVKLQLARLPASVRKGLASNVYDQRKQAEQLAASHVVKAALGRYEVLSDTPLPPGTDLFTRAAYGGADGSSPMIEGDSLSRG